MHSILPYCTRADDSGDFLAFVLSPSKTSAWDTEVSLWHFLMSPPLHPSFTNMNCIWPDRCCRAVRHSSSLNHSLEYWYYFPSIRIKSERHSWDWSHFFSLSPRSCFHSKGQGDRLAAACLMHMDVRCSICCRMQIYKPLSLLFFCLRQRPCQTLHGLTCWSH